MLGLHTSSRRLRYRPVLERDNYLDTQEWKAGALVTDLLPSAFRYSSDFLMKCNEQARDKRTRPGNDIFERHAWDIYRVKSILLPNDINCVCRIEVSPRLALALSNVRLSRSYLE